MIHRFLVQKGLELDLKMGACLKIITSEHFNNDFFNLLANELKSDTFSVPWVNFKGVKYKPGMLSIIDIDLNGCIFNSGFR